MKKVTASLIALLLAVTMIACGSVDLKNTKEAGSDPSGPASASEKESSMVLTVSPETVAPTEKKAESSTEMSTEETTEPPTETETEPEEKKTAVLTAAVSALPKSIDPLEAESAEEESLFAHLYTGLYFRDRNYLGEAETAPGIADGLPEISGDGLTATIRLKTTQWSDGTPLTANDFAESFLHAQALLAGTGKAALFSVFDTKTDIPFAEATDEQTLVLHLAGPCVYLADLLCDTVFLPRKAGRADGHALISNGPFILGEAGTKEWTLLKNPRYFQANLVTVDELRYTQSSYAENQYLSYKAGLVDVIGLIPSVALSRYAGDSSLRTERLYSVIYLRFNLSAAVFEEKSEQEAVAMRRALNLLIDRQALKNDVWGEKCLLAETLVPPGMSDGNSGIFEKNRSFFDAKTTGRESLTEAMELLTSAGYTFTETGNGFYQIEPELSLSIMVGADSGDMATVMGISEDFSILGIGLTVIGRRENDPVFSFLNKDCTMELCRLSAEYDDPSAILSAITVSSVTGPEGISNDSCRKFSAYLSEAAATIDPDRRALALKDAEDALMSGWSVLPLCYESDTYLLARGVSGIYETPFGVRMYLYAEKE